jgi:adenylate cyclase
MLFERLPRFNQWIRAHGLGDGFRMGIGLNSGETLSGQVGSEQRMEYAAIGDTTNTAARLEAMTKDSPHSVFIADSTRRLLRGGTGGLDFVEEMQIRGRKATIRIWTLSSDSAGSETGADRAPVSDPETGGDL